MVTFTLASCYDSSVFLQCNSMFFPQSAGTPSSQQKRQTQGKSKKLIATEAQCSEPKQILSLARQDGKQNKTFIGLVLKNFTGLT